MVFNHFGRLRMNQTGKRIITLASAVLGFLVFSYSSLRAAQWTPMGPSSFVFESTPPMTDVGRLLYFAADPTNAANHWLVSGMGTGVFESKDAGHTWAPRTDNMP